MKFLIPVGLLMLFSFFPLRKGSSQSSNEKSWQFFSPNPIPVKVPAAAPAAESAIVLQEKQRTDSINKDLIRRSILRDREYDKVLTRLSVAEAENKQLRAEIKLRDDSQAVNGDSDHTEADYTSGGKISPKSEALSPVTVDLSSEGKTVRKKNFFRRLTSIFNKKRNATESAIN